MQGFQEYLIEASQNTESLKKGLVGYINDVLTYTNGTPISIKSGKHIIPNIVAARPFNKPGRGGIAPYVDIELIQSNGQIVRVALRLKTGAKFDSRSVPALAKGLDTLEKVLPNVRRDFLAGALGYYTGKASVNHGQAVPMVGGKLDARDKQRVLLGGNDLGGEADYVLAVARQSFKFKDMRIPHIKAKPSGMGLQLDIKEAVLYNKVDVMKNNDIYLWMPKSKGRTLYLGNDEVDAYNYPVLIGPKFSKVTRPGARHNPKDYGAEIVASLNIRMKETFVIRSGEERLFKMELRKPSELASFSTAASMPASAGGSQSDDDDDDAGDQYDVEARDDAMEELVNNFVRGMKVVHSMDIDDNEEEVEQLQAHLDDEDTQTIQQLALLSPHRLIRQLGSMGFALSNA